MKKRLIILGIVILLMIAALGIIIHVLSSQTLGEELVGQGIYFDSAGHERPGPIEHFYTPSPLEEKLEKAVDFLLCCVPVLVIVWIVLFVKDLKQRRKAREAAKTARREDIYE